MRIISLPPKDDDSNIRMIDMEVPLDEIVPFPGRHNMFCGFCKRGDNYPECTKTCPVAFDVDDEHEDEEN